MTDRDATLHEIKERIVALVLEKGWSENGIQNPQHVAMAMTVEMSELLEHFQWLNAEDVDAMLAGSDRERVALIAEECADVMIYGLQLCYSLNIDLAAEIERKLRIVRNRADG